ncbi:bolA-like protein 3 isoform X2 [Petaurus breviceps papuanus]|uniref:bolA-like protein 3 isoform X2 n=1 Tax=Petaurus breviceps papuanus TaxID=3040969 RepID=UPI0036DD4236
MAAPAAAAAASQLLCRRNLGVVPLLQCAQRTFASQTSGELKMTRILKEKFPRAATIKVTDISGEFSRLAPHNPPVRSEFKGCCPHFTYGQTESQVLSPRVTKLRH